MPSSSSLRSCLLLGLATLCCLLPFSGKAFHIDDPLFVWTAQHIVEQPWNPYGFRVVWYATDMAMSEVTKNPPLASYYGALISSVGGWSERAWHLGFLLPALALVLGTYRLAKWFTNSPVIAALATLLAPGLLVSATGVMCDVMMLALWVWAVIFWLRGSDSGKSLDFAVSALLIAVGALTKYFGASLILLLAAHSLLDRQRVRGRIWWLLIPVAVLVWYQVWTKSLYGRGLLWDAAQYARTSQHEEQSSRLMGGLIGLSFVGGCALPVLLFAPFLWKRWQLMVGAVAGAWAGLAVGRGWLNPLIHRTDQHWGWIGVQFAVYVAGGFSVLALAFSDYRRHRDAASVLLGLWVLGTFVFATFLNWTVNARSVLPLIPAAAILLARRLADARMEGVRWSTAKLAVPMLLSLVISLWVAWGDMAFANSQREMARRIHEQTQHQIANVFFEGHWGFQYYMELIRARPVEGDYFAFQTGDLVVTPENTTNTFPIPPQLVAAQEIQRIDLHTHAASMELGGGFYSSVWGPIPFGFGQVPSEPYLIVRLQRPNKPSQ